MSTPSPLPYSSRLRVCLAIARGIAAARGDQDVTPLHVALGILREGENPAVAALMHAGVSMQNLRFEIEQALAHPTSPPRPAEVCLGATPGEQRIIETGSNLSRDRGDEYLGPQHLMLALIHDADSEVARIFARHGIDSTSGSAHVDAIFAPHEH